MPLILGIDPGSHYTGYGLINKEGSRLTLVEADRVSTKATAPLADRLRQVYEGLTAVLARHTPQAVAVEDIFYAKNIQSAVRLGHVRGVALLVAACAGLPVFEYSPAQIKMAVVGYGRAEKSQVALMVRRILNLAADTGPPLAEDATDALAVAICHLHQTPAWNKPPTLAPIRGGTRATPGKR